MVHVDLDPAAYRLAKAAAAEEERSLKVVIKRALEDAYRRRVSEEADNDRDN